MTIFIFKLLNTRLGTPPLKSNYIIISNATPGTDHFYRAAKYWNNLDQHTTSVKSQTVFKSKLKTISLENL